jgi:hypothetical protein
VWSNYIVLSKETFLLGGMGQKTVCQVSCVILDHYYGDIYLRKFVSLCYANIHYKKLLMERSANLSNFLAEFLQSGLAIEPNFLVYACNPWFIYFVSYIGKDP